MTPALTLWLAFVIGAGAIAWFGSWRQAFALAIVAGLTAPATFLPLGHASPFRPQCPCTVLGARIDPEVAIWVLLDGPEPRFHKLPYSQMAANSLQSALDGAAERQSTIKMQLGEDGSPGFAEEAPPPEPAKSAERAGAAELRPTLPDVTAAFGQNPEHNTAQLQPALKRTEKRRSQ